MTYYVRQADCLFGYKKQTIGCFKPNLWVFKKTKGWVKTDICLLDEIKNPRLFYIGEEPPVDIEPSIFYAVEKNKQLKKKFQEAIYLTFYIVAQDPLTNLCYVSEVTTIRECFQAYQKDTLKFEHKTDALHICAFLNNLIKKDWPMTDSTITPKKLKTADSLFPNSTTSRVY